MTKRTERPSLRSTLAVRLEDEQIVQFHNKCARMQRTSAGVMREMIHAFNEGRVKIIPDPNKPDQELYHHEY